MKYRIILTTLFCLLFANAYTQTSIKITGKVTRLDTKEPLAYACIRVKDSNIGAISDIDGTYTLEIPKPSKKGIILQCSFVGFQTLEAEVKDGTVINFEMPNDLDLPSHPYFISFQARDLDIYGSTPTTYFGIGYTAVNVSPFWRANCYNSFLKKLNFSASYHTDFSDNMVVKSEVEELVNRSVIRSLHAGFSRYDIPESEINMNTYMVGTYVKPFGFARELAILGRVQVTDFRYANQHADWALHVGGKYGLLQGNLRVKAGFAHWFNNQSQYYGGIEVSLWNYFGDFVYGSWMGEPQINASIRGRFKKFGLTVAYERFLDYENVSLKLSVRLATPMEKTYF